VQSQHSCLFYAALVRERTHEVLPSAISPSDNSGFEFCGHIRATTKTGPQAGLEDQREH
jgi:hypothetical protein